MAVGYVCSEHDGPCIVASTRSKLFVDSRAPVGGVGLLGFLTAFGRGWRFGCVVGSDHESKGCFRLGVVSIKLLLDDIEVLVAAMGKSCCIRCGDICEGGRIASGAVSDVPKA